jgi:hypothetical protein
VRAGAGPAPPGSCPPPEPAVSLIRSNIPYPTNRAQGLSPYSTRQFSHDDRRTQPKRNHNARRPDNGAARRPQLPRRCACRFSPRNATRYVPLEHRTL